MWTPLPLNFGPAWGNRGQIIARRPRAGQWTRAVQVPLNPLGKALGKGTEITH
jgi:hypothetical protein